MTDKFRDRLKLLASLVGDGGLSRDRLLAVLPRLKAVCAEIVQWTADDLGLDRPVLPTTAETVTHGDVHQWRSECDAAFNALPPARRTRRPMFQKEFIAAMGRADEPPDQAAAMLRERLVAYYASPMGRSRYARAPWTWLAEDGWLEPAEAWERQTAEDERESSQRSLLRRGLAVGLDGP